LLDEEKEEKFVIKFIVVRELLCEQEWEMEPKAGQGLNPEFHSSSLAWSYAQRMLTEHPPTPAGASPCIQARLPSQ